MEYDTTVSRNESFVKTQNKIIEDQQENFWARRSNQAAIWSLLNIISNFIVQISAVLKPINQMHFTVNLIYLAVGIIQLLGVFLSFWKKMYFLNYYILCIHIIRNSLRPFDFE
jgi:hypothetical protein